MPFMCLLIPWRQLFTPDVLKIVVPIVIASFALAGSIIALVVALRDRRPSLTLRARKGEWCTLKAAVKGGEVIFVGVVELYNASARANVILNYDFWCKTDAGWKKMDSEYYKQSPPIGAMEEICNKTPLTLGPYSGIDLHVIAFIKMPQPYEMTVRIEVEDLFGKRYQVEVLAKS